MKAIHCESGHCLCDAIATVDDPPEVGRRVQVYSDKWEFITWNNGDDIFFTHWRADLDMPVCES